MFAIIVSGGSRDDAWEEVRFVTDDEKKGQAFVEKMNGRCEVAKNAESLCDEWASKWEKGNPSPIVEPTVDLPYERWDSKTKVTQMMRDERARIQKQNDLARLEAYRPRNEWHEKKNMALEVWKKETFSKEVLMDMDKPGIETEYWEMKAVAWLE